MVQAFQSWTDRLPPQCVDAEEKLLGGVLIDPHAIGRVADTLHPEAFYIHIHKEIYKAALAVHSQGLPVDLMSVTLWLHEHELLEAIGGQNKLAELVECTVSAVNADRLAELIMDKYYRRQLIQTGHEIAQIAHEKGISQEELNEFIEKKLLGKKGLLHALKPESKRSIDRYHQMIAAVQEIELEVENPGLKRWELQRIASKFGCSIKVLEECWYHNLIYSGAVQRETWTDIKKLAGEYREWLLHGFLPKQGLVLLHAEGGTGKTRLFYDWTFCLAFGQAWNETFEVTKSQRRVLLVQTDELASEMFEALQVRGLEDNPNVAFVRSWDINNIAALNRQIEEFDPDVIFVDSLNSVSSNFIVSENDVEYARPILALRKLAEQHDKLILLTHHSNRQGDIRGSTAIKASCSLEMKLSRDPQFPAPDSGRRILTLGKTRSYRRPAEYSIEFDAETGQWSWLGEHSKQESGDADLPLKDRIVNFLAANRNQRFEYEEIHQDVGGGLHSVRRAASQLAADGIISRVKKDKRSLFFLAWEGGQPNHRHDQQSAHDHDDHNDDHNGNAHPVSVSESRDHVIIKNSVLEPTPEAENLRSHDHNFDHEAQSQEPASDTSYDPVHDHVVITPEKRDRKRDHEPENTQNSNTSLQSRDHDHECDRICDREIFPSVNCQVGKVIDGERKRGWKGWIREIVDEQTVKVWWEGEFDLSRNGKTVKEKDGTNREKLTIESLENLCPFSGDTNKGLGRAYSSKHLPKKGDRVESCYGGVGEVTLVRSSNPRYEIAWNNGRTMGYTLKDLEDLDVREIGVSHANG